MRKASVDDDSEFDDAADDAIAPILLSETAIDHLNLVSDAFSRALVWATEAKSMVQMGWRLTAMIAVMRPELLERAPSDRVLEKELIAALGNVNPFEVGSGYWRLLAWCRRCKSLSQMGQRTFAMIYVLRRDLLSGRNTNAAIASLQNKTRQAFNRTVGNFRDTFAGFRNAVMRGEKTRTKCRDAQLN
ncbi:MAG: hypothetical protein V7609_2114 [Verrucomicrobiota bacterium]